MKHRLKNLKIYNLALELSIEIYELTKSFPKEEKFGIISQLRRASSSVGANIAEGFNRRTFKEKRQFCILAKGSVSEVTFFLDLSEGLKYITSKVKDELISKYIDLDVKIHNYIKFQENKT